MLKRLITEDLRMCADIVARQQSAWLAQMTHWDQSSTPTHTDTHRYMNGQQSHGYAVTIIRLQINTIFFKKATSCYCIIVRKTYLKTKTKPKCLSGTSIELISGLIVFVNDNYELSLKGNSSSNLKTSVSVVFISG